MTASRGARLLSAGAWRRLPIEVGDPRHLLARGVELLDQLEDDPAPSLRWYRPTRTAIVLGRGQARDLPAGSTGDVEVLTRFSGGGAVLLDPDLLSLDVLVPAGDPFLDGDLTAVFSRVGAVWADALTQLGVVNVAVHQGAADARRQGDARQRLLAAVCYATLGRGEVTTDGRKLVGLAQRRRRPGALVQCGLLRRWNPAPLLAAFGTDPQDPEIHAAAVGLHDLPWPGGRAPGDERVMRSVERSFEESRD